MKVLISGGAKSHNIVNSIQAKFNTSGDEFLVIPYLEDIPKLYARGDYFDKAIISLQSITRDGEIRDEVTIRQKINEFALDSARRGRKASYVFLSYAEDIATIMQEETLPIGRMSVVVLQRPPYSVQFFVELIVNDIAQISKDWVFKAPTIGNSIYNDELFSDNDDSADDVDTEQAVVIKDADDSVNDYNYYDDTDNSVVEADDIELPDDLFDSESDELWDGADEEEEAADNNFGFDNSNEGTDDSLGFDDNSNNEWTGTDNGEWTDEEDGEWTGDENEDWTDEENNMIDGNSDWSNETDDFTDEDTDWDNGDSNFVEDDNADSDENNSFTDEDNDWSNENEDFVDEDNDWSNENEDFVTDGDDTVWEDDEQFENNDNNTNADWGYDENPNDYVDVNEDNIEEPIYVEEGMDTNEDGTGEIGDDSNSLYDDEPDDNFNEDNEAFITDDESSDFNESSFIDEEVEADGHNGLGAVANAAAVGIGVAAGLGVAGKVIGDKLSEGITDMNINNKNNNNGYIPGFDDGPDEFETNPDFGFDGADDTDTITGFDNNNVKSSDSMLDEYDESMYDNNDYEESGTADAMLQGYDQNDYSSSVQTGVNYEEMSEQLNKKKKGMFGLFKKGTGNKANDMSMANSQALNGGPSNVPGGMPVPGPVNLGDPVNPAMPIMNGKGRPININKVRDSLRPFAARGNAITVTGFGGCGTSTIAYSLANIICQLGYTVLLVDLDIKGRTQSYITRTNYETMEPDGANVMAAVNSSTGIKKQMTVVKEGFHLLTMGLGADIHPIEEIIKKEKLNRFFNTVKNEHQFVIYDIPFEVATDYCSEITYNSDNIVTVADCSNWGLAKMMLQVCNIESEDMQDTIFNRAQLVLNKHRNLSKVFGQRFNNGYDILRIVDKQVLDIVGEDIGFHFSSLHLSGILDDDKMMEDGWFGGSHYSDTRKGQNIFIELLQSIVLKK
jgi:cellulose biosynthesis protein BcsQ